MANEIHKYLAYANVQMAAEATGFAAGPHQSIQVDVLTAGNGRSSKFPKPLADSFITEWEILDHQPNTTTGFSGTLFKYKGQNDPLSGLKNGDVVMALRSTEFVDDAVRDSKGTNELEIKAHGFAFGQLSDMWAWYEKLNANSGLLQDMESAHA